MEFRVELSSQQVTSHLEENGRRETRKRKPAVDVYSPDIQQPVQSSAHFHDWTHQEKTALLDALKTYGHYDIENLCKAVPTKSKNHIKMAIDMWWKAARIAMNASSSGEKRNKDKLKLVPKRGRGRPSVPRGSGITGRAPIDQWLHKLEESQPLVGHLQSKLLAKVFLYISKYEEHPPPEKCGGVDYRALYEYLYCMLNGYPCKMLSKESASFVLNSLNDMAVAMRERGTKEEAFFLDRLHRIPGQVRRCYGKEGPSKTSFASPSEELISKLVKIQGFNPLEVPVDLLKSK
ncbi:uncharacterized protein [Periplaneta americana]|uniref:uncharacterized protein isoform X2 n=1 Tax=Periplaneta americana TaxID=6978 RepID=UPI0037E873D0